MQLAITTEPVPAQSVGQVFADHIDLCSQDWSFRTRTLLPSSEGFYYGRPNGVVQRMSIEDLIGESLGLAPALSAIRAEMVAGF